MAGKDSVVFSQDDPDPAVLTHAIARVLFSTENTLTEVAVVQKVGSV